MLSRSRAVSGRRTSSAAIGGSIAAPTSDATNVRNPMSATAEASTISR